MMSINEIAKNVHDRLEFLEFMLRFRGWVSRADLTERFGLKEAAATRDIRLYRDYAENNMELNQRTKKYEILDDSFKPLFELTAQRALAKIRTEKICEALGMSDFDGVLCPPRLSLPCLDVLSNITRAISSGAHVNAQYFSVQNGHSEKHLFPQAIFDNGFNWYLRAFDTKKNEYRTYVLTRFLSVSVDTESELTPELKTKDFQWNRMVPLELVPHPNRKNVPCPETLIHNFRMKDGCLKIIVRAIVAGYWLRHWNVDCTEDHSLKGYNYQLWLRNHHTLYDVESRKIAPGLADYFEND